MNNTVIKTHPASTSYGRGSDNSHQPATYAVVNAEGKRIGIIKGTRAGYMERSSWTVNFDAGNGVPILIRYADSFKAAKAWAQKWDGNFGVRAEWRAETTRRVTAALVELHDLQGAQ